MNKCNLIGDLLPLYSEKLLSEDSIKVVERHLEKCEVCAKKAKMLLSPERTVPEESKTSSAERAVLRRTKQKFRLKTFFVTTGAVILSGVVVFFSAYSFAMALRSRDIERMREIEEFRAINAILDSCRSSVLEQSLVRHEPIDIVYSLHNDYEITSLIPNGAQTYKIFLPDLVQFMPNGVNSWYYTSTGNPEAAYISAKQDTALADIAKRSLDITSYTPALQALKNGYSSLYNYSVCRSNGDQFVNIAKYVLEYSFDGLTTESPSRDINIAYAANAMRGYFVDKYGWKSNGEYYPIEYYPITGSLKGYALFIQMAPLGNENPGHWEIHLQSESAVWSLEFWVRDTAKDSFVSNIENMTEYLSHIRFE